MFTTTTCHVDHEAMRRYSLFGALGILTVKNLYDACKHAMNVKIERHLETNSGIMSTIQRQANEKHKQNALACLRDAAGYSFFGMRYYYPISALPSSFF